MTKREIVIEDAHNSNLCASNIITDTFKCSLERAFKTPILGDVTKILMGYGGAPVVVGFNQRRKLGCSGRKQSANYARRFIDEK